MAPVSATVQEIWDHALHNAFTDLIRFEGRWLCAFREGSAHVSPDGCVRVIASTDGQTWTSVAHLSSVLGDLRDPKLSVTPDGDLMLVSAAKVHAPAEARLQSLVWFSPDGQRWSGPTPIGDEDVWIWRVTWHAGRCYGVGYGTGNGWFARLYAGRDGREFTALDEDLFSKRRDGKERPNEATLAFLDDGTGLCLLRREAGTCTAQLGSAPPPYTAWTWKDLGRRLGGPHLIQLPDGRLVAGGRLYIGAERTALLWLDPGEGRLDEFLTLPSGGDSSYPGLVWHEGMLWVSFYSSHEGKASIYLAKVGVPPAAA